MLLSTKELPYSKKKGDDPQKLTIRELAGRLGIGVGLVNYHFGSKEVLVNRCVKKMIMSIVEEFHKVRTSLAYMKPKEKLNYLCLMTFDYLYTKPNVSKVALIYDLGNTSNDDNDVRTYRRVYTNRQRLQAVL